MREELKDADWLKDVFASFYCMYALAFYKLSVQKKQKHVCVWMWMAEAEGRVLDRVSTYKHHQSSWDLIIYSLHWRKQRAAMYLGIFIGVCA